MAEDALIETRPRAWLRPALPAALLALSTFWTGTLVGGATFSGAWVGAAALFVFVLGSGRGLLDPLRLGPVGRWTVWILAAAVVASWSLSDVPRSGRVGLLLAVAFVLVPGSVAACWRDVRERELGLGMLRWAIASVAGWALFQRLLSDAPDGSWNLVSPTLRVAEPLGHHSLLGVWVVVLLPLAKPPERSSSTRRSTVRTMLAWLPFGLAVIAVLGTSSLAAAAACAVQLSIVVWRLRTRWGLAALAVSITYLVVHYGSRAAGGLAGEDTSFAARWVYYQGGWDGFVVRPWLGHGPGATPWTLAEYLVPRPGINDPSEIVGQLHSLPLQGLYELGLVGASLAALVVGWFILRRLREGVSGASAAALVGLAGGGVASLACAWFDIGALVWAFAIAFGVALGPRPPRTVAPAERWGTRAVVLLAAGATVGPLLAMGAYERAIRAGGAGPEAVRALARAVALDPAFPLYAARRASLEESREAALDAAARAPAIAAFHLSAGSLGSVAAARRARDLDPLGAVAPMLLAVSAPNPDETTTCAARALLAEPTLLAARIWDDREELRSEALSLISDWPWVDAGWKAELLRLATTVPAVSSPEADDGARLAYGREAVSGGLSVWAFRRMPWPEPWLLLPVDPEVARAIDLPSAARLPLTSAEAFPKGRCRPRLAS